MRLITDKPEVVRQLERDVLRSIVLLKHLNAYPDHTRVALVGSDNAVAALVILDARASDCDSKAYPGAAYVVLINSDQPVLTRELLVLIPQGQGVVFKLSSDEDRDIVQEAFVIERSTSFLSFTCSAKFPADDRISVSNEASDTMFEMFRSQDHSREWLHSLLIRGRAFTCALHSEGELVSACLAFENHGSVWEIGGVVTVPSIAGGGSDHVLCEL